MAKKKPAKKPAEEKSEKLIITNEFRRTWFLVRSAWNRNRDSFSAAMSLVTGKKAEDLYDVVKHAVYKDSYAEMLHEHPELKEIVRSDDDRICMLDIYELLSWRLNRREPPPKERRIATRMKGGIGRDAPVYS